MIRFLLLVALFFLAVLGFDWLKDAPGEFALTLNNTVYVVGLARAVAGLIAVIAAILIVLWLASFVWRVPGGTLRALRGRKNIRGREAVSRGLIAIAAGDVRAAERASAEAAKIAPGAPLTMLLQAQTAQMKGDADTARSAFTAMLDDQRTQIAGLRGLHVEADRAGEPGTARHFATKARELTHQAPWANRAMLRHQIAKQDWASALATLSASADARNVDRKLLRRHRAVILTAQAIDIEESDPQTARQLAIEAHGLAPELAPAATVAGRLLTRLGEIRRAVKILETSWKAAPHPEIADAYAHVRSGDSARDRLKRIESLARMRPQADEGRLAVARAAIDARDWSVARAALAPVLRTRPTQNALILMSEVEEAEHGDRGRAREWLARAVHASRDPVWIADGMELDAWAPVSPVSGRIDAVEWRIPTTQLGPPAEIDLGFASDDTASTSRLSVPAICRPSLISSP
ncbi:MAG: heme biosynthesis protein HemY [Alphaproteobacteria bacterium]